MRESTMTAETARTFNGYSVANAVTVTAALRDRGCSCEPYADVFTFNRWRAQGRTVRKGEQRTPSPRRGTTTPRTGSEKCG